MSAIQLLITNYRIVAKDRRPEDVMHASFFTWIDTAQKYHNSYQDVHHPNKRTATTVTIVAKLDTFQNRLYQASLGRW